jgi:ArsR family transcriptional regulator
MLILVYMMSKTEPGLRQRLDRLGGDDASCCVSKYEGLARVARRSRAFSGALRRHQALADEHRLTAVALLKRRNELCACEIQAATGLTHATVSHHMRILVDAGLVSARRRGKWMYYRLAASPRGVLP